MKRYALLLLAMMSLASPTLMVGSCCSTSCSTSSNCCSTSSSNCDDCGCPCAGKTYFQVRPMYHSYRPEFLTSFRNDRMVAAENGIHGAFDLVVYGGRSTNGNDLAKYFLPNCRNCLISREDPILNDDTSLDAADFNVFTVNTLFESTLAFNASHSEVGVGLHYKQAWWFNEENTRWWYLDIALPITHVRNRLQLCESVINNGGGVNTAVPGAVATMTQAFVQPAWNYGRIDGCTQNKTGVADIELKLGYQWWYDDCCHIASFIGAWIPTSKGPNACRVFEPILGYGGHVGVIIGSEFGFKVWSNCDDRWQAHFEVATMSQYLFSHQERRSFDLKNRPWSRYLPMYANLAQATAASTLDVLPGETLSTPGINLLTQCVNVTPGFINNITSAFILSNECGFSVEAGYNFYNHQAECVKLACAWQTGPALKATLGAGATNPVRTISGNTQVELISVPLADYASSLIQASDLDLQSAAHPAIITHLLYGALAYNWDDRCYPIHANIGGSYEFAGKEYAVMKRWGVWGKVGVAF